jgi:hypothetical protein
MPDDAKNIQKTEKIILERPEWRAAMFVNVVENEAQDTPDQAAETVFEPRSENS